MKPSIIKNLFLSVDFTRQKTKSGITIEGNGRQFYLIGTLPVLLIHEGGKKEITKLKDKEPIACDDPYLRKLLGVRATENLEYIKKYREPLTEIVLRLEKAIDKMAETKIFAGKRIEKLAIIAMK
ncbi:MAG: hypothetical protein C4519_24315 [Desulfobacteraceae bacterium]|nr:MAG: hypothetical protein C4519_24315 [Desulfobacteraceae bacterium]